jgi:hypothetical protein
MPRAEPVTSAVRPLRSNNLFMLFPRVVRAMSASAVLYGNA